MFYHCTTAVGKHFKLDAFGEQQKEIMPLSFLSLDGSIGITFDIITKIL
jgi:hypothetical protein